MTGAIEFLRKAKAICKSRAGCVKCPLEEFCETSRSKISNESDLVRKVMDYQIKEASDAERN